MTLRTTSFEDFKRQRLDEKNDCLNHEWEIVELAKDINISQDKNINDMKKNPELEKYINALINKKINDLKNFQNKIVIIEEMDMKTAKERVLEYTQKHKVFDIEELHQNIRCELKLLIKIIDDLKKEGRITEEN